eukprot:TRINITY_DN12066_c0_g1_i1.p1 TRINITY_DN12066_c0_g1~~TRINITY_DN12066_c0_g1_i1.p1  ORF type:complete len:455 (+),score=83.39 TRINITY_DN12066_c0_g1_i1:95-1459(+)
MPMSATVHQVREVWAWNLQTEFLRLLAVLRAAGPGATAAFDSEFPGCMDDTAWRATAQDVRYKAMRDSVNLISPIQMGLALASAEGRLLGAWTFNLRYDLHHELHTDAAVHFLSAAGIDFPRHAAEGIDRWVLGSLLSESPLVGAASPTWLTFSGLYDLGYLLKLLVPDPLPRDMTAFEEALDGLCRRRLELRDWLPHGSLESLARHHGIVHCQAHTAGSDALVTLKLFLRAGPPHNVSAPGEQPIFDFSEISSSEEGEDRDGSDIDEPFAAAFGNSTKAAPSVRMPLGVCPVRGWGIAARWALHTARGGSQVAKAAPSTLWGAAARGALVAARAPSWGLAARQGLEETRSSVQGAAAREALVAARAPSWGLAARQGLEETRSSVQGAAAPEAVVAVGAPSWGLAARQALEVTRNSVQGAAAGEAFVAAGATSWGLAARQALEETRSSVQGAPC